jgi:hypothetical protein
MIARASSSSTAGRAVSLAPSFDDMRRTLVRITGPSAATRAVAYLSPAADVGGVSPGPGADVGGVSPVGAQMWAG